MVKKIIGNKFIGILVMLLVLFSFTTCAYAVTISGDVYGDNLVWQIRTTQGLTFETSYLSKDKGLDWLCDQGFTNIRQSDQDISYCDGTFDDSADQFTFSTYNIYSGYYNQISSWVTNSSTGNLVMPGPVLNWMGNEQKISDYRTYLLLADGGIIPYKDSIPDNALVEFQWGNNSGVEMQPGDSLQEGLRFHILSTGDVPNPSYPSIGLTKKASVAEAEVGAEIIYTYTVTNTGDVALTGVTVTDDKLGAITMAKTDLAPGESTTGTATYTVQDGDLPGPLQNTATATGHYNDTTVTARDDASVNLLVNPSIAITKKASVAEAEVGAEIIYTYTVTNTGDVALTGVTVTDDKLGAIAVDKTDLAPGESTTGTATYTVQDGDLPGPLQNTATATGHYNDTIVTARDDASVNLLVNPSIAITKKASVAEAEVGAEIIYNYTVTNTGDAALTGVTVTDDKLGAIAMAKTDLAPGESTTGTATYTVQDGDLPGPLQNTATATGHYNDMTVTARDDASVIILVPCEELYGLTPGYWKNWRNHYSTKQFNALLAGTIAPNINTANVIFSKFSAKPGMELTIIKAHLLATQLTLNLTKMPELPNPDDCFLVEGGLVEWEGVEISIGDAVQQALDILANPQSYTRNQILEVKNLLDYINNL